MSLFRRSRFGEVIERQLDLFERDHRDVIEECDERLAAYTAAERDDAEELYGDYADAVETGTELLAGMRDRFGATLAGGDADVYEQEFNRAASRRMPRFASELENR